MTREKAKALLPIITAWANGKEIEYYTCHEWTRVSDISFDDSPKSYRIAKDSKSLMEKFTDHGPVIWVRRFGGIRTQLVLDINETGVVVYDGTKSWEFLASSYEISTDLVKWFGFERQE